MFIGAMMLCSTILIGGMEPAATGTPLLVQDLTRYVQETFPWKDAEISVELTRHSVRIPADRHVQVESFRPRRFSGPIAFQVSWGPTAADRAWVSSNVIVRKEIVVASRQLDRNEIITAKDLMVAMVDASDTNTLQMSDLIGRRVRRPIQPGMALKTTDLLADEVVRPGDPLVLRLTGATFTISAPAVALSTGHVGGQIRIRNLSTGRTLSAVLLTPGEAIVQDGGLLN